MKCRFLVLASILLSSNVFCESIFHIEGSVLTGISSNILNEAVYQDSELLSELSWNSTVAPLVSNQLSFLVKDLIARIVFDYTIPVKTGYIEDYDFLFADKSLVSNYSYHDLFIDKSYGLDFSVGYKFSLKKFYFTPTVGFLYVNKKYSAKDGYYQYSYAENSSVNSKTKKTELRGTVMAYEISAIEPYFCISIDFLPFKQHDFNFSVVYSPFLFVSANDTHILRLTEFYDTLNNGYGFSVQTCYSYYISKTICLKLLGQVCYRSCNGTSAVRTIGEKSDFAVTDNVRSEINDFEEKVCLGIGYRMF